MRKMALYLTFLAAAYALAPLKTAQAALIEAWVASFGSDSNPCTRSQPCATFVRALAQTSPGGEITCVDQGDFSTGNSLLISQAITIDCEGVQGRFNYDSGGTAISISAAPDEVVILRGLIIESHGFSAFGITFVSGAALHLEKCLIRGFNQIGGGWGLTVETEGANSASDVFVSDTVFENNGTASTGGGILVQPTGANIVTKAVLDRVETRNNFFGIKADGTATSGGGVINMTVRDSVSSGNRLNGIVGTGNTNGPAIVMMIDRSASSHNAAGFGVIADGPKTTIRLGGSSVAGNINGVGASNGGLLQSYGNNQINGNSNDGIAALTPIGLH